MMIPALVLSLLAQSPQVTPDYSVPLGSSSEFHHLVLDIGQALADKQYTTAEKLSGLLPHSIITYRLDSSKLSESQKEEFGTAIKIASQNWEGTMSHLITFQQVNTEKADILFSFEPILAKISGTNEVAGATWFLAKEPVPPFVEAVIGLKRGPKLEKVIAREVFNESMFTFGRYLGLAANPQLGNAMGRIEGQMGNPSAVSKQETVTAKKILALSSLIKTAIHKRETINVGHPVAKLEKTSLQFDTQFQGDQGRAQFLITNNGNAPLELSIHGDCGCVGGSVAPVLEPGKSTLVTGIFDTRELVGDVHHNLILHTNDPDQPTILIQVSITVTPRAEAIYPVSNTAYSDTNQNSYSFYIHSAEDKLFNITDAVMSEASMKVKVDRFDGEGANYLKPGQKQKIHGYKVTVDLSKYPWAALFGRAMGVVYLRTDSEKIKVVKLPFYLQRGIVALPESIYFGSPKGSIDSFFVLTRPGHPFTIKKIGSECKYLTFQVTRNDYLNGSEYSIRILYDGKAPGHKFKSEIVIETDDPKQSIIRLPVQTSGI